MAPNLFLVPAQPPVTKEGKKEYLPTWIHQRNYLDIETINCNEQAKLRHETTYLSNEFSVMEL